MTELIVPLKYASLVKKCSSAMLIPICVSLYRRHYDLSASYTMLMMTSINYWHKPIKGWRRNIDISCACLSGAYHLYRARKSRMPLVYYGLSFLGASFYPLSYYCKSVKKGVYLHIFLHFMAHLANIFLYTTLPCSYSTKINVKMLSMLALCFYFDYYGNYVRVYVRYARNCRSALNMTHNE